MKITKDLGLFRQTEEYNYTPSVEELYFWYSGTHSGFTRDNPYHRTGGMTATRRRLTPVKDLRLDDPEATTTATNTSPNQSP